MEPAEGSQLEKALRLGAGRVGFEAVVPKPKLKLLEKKKGWLAASINRPPLRGYKKL